MRAAGSVDAHSVLQGSEGAGEGRPSGLGVPRGLPASQGGDGTGAEASKERQDVAPSRNEAAEPS